MTTLRLQRIAGHVVRTFVCAALVLACGFAKPMSSRGAPDETGTQPVASEAIYMEVRALDGMTPPIQFSQPVRLSNGADQSLVVPAPVRARGAVRVGTDPVEGATISFSIHGGIPNRTPAPLQTQSKADGTFEIILPDGSYSVLAYPPRTTNAGTALPPRYFADIATDGADQNWDFPLWDFQSLPQFTGLLQLMDGTGLAGVQVTALDGAASVSRHLLTTPVLSGTGGAFTMTLPPIDELPASVKLRLSAGTPTGIAFPTLEPEQLFASGVLTSGALQLPLATATITGTVRDIYRSPVPRARVTVIAQPSLLGVAAPFEFQDSIVTADDGTFAITVYTAGDGSFVNYSLVAVPSSLTVVGAPGLCRPTSTAGVVVTADENLLPVAAGDSLEQDLTCDRLLSYTGFVRNSQTSINPVANTRVTATLAPSRDLPTGLSVQTRTDVDGNFTFALTSGTYDFAFAPPDSSGEPFTLYSARNITLATAPVGAQFAFTLLPPFALKGRLYLGDPQHPLAAQIDAYQVHGTTAIKIASTLTSTDGKYSLILPGSQVRQ